jgi:hypothetical protein
MRIAILFAASCLLPALVLAKGPTTRIEVGQGKRAMVVLTGEESAGQFRVDEADFADLAAGPVEAPQGVTVYSVRFYCAADAPGHESIPSNQCYGVRYAVAPGGLGYIQMEGNWYRASTRWDETIRPRLAAVAEAARQDDNRRLYQQPPRVYRQSSPSTRATSATPRVTPKH